MEAMTETASPRPKLELSATGVVAGALASVTSAVLGSQLGTAGTLVGAALGSAVGAVATAVYSFGLKSTTHHISTISDRLRHTEGDDADDAETASDDADTTGDAAAPDRESGATGDGPAERPTVATAWRRPVTWWTIAGVLVSAVIAFVIALGIITGLESATGTSLSGTQGTTVSNLAQEADTGTDNAAAAASATPVATATTTTATVTTEATASATPTVEETTAAPTTTATAQAVATPAVSATTSATDTSTPASADAYVAG